MGISTAERVPLYLRPKVAEIVTQRQHELALFGQESGKLTNLRTVDAKQPKNVNSGMADDQTEQPKRITQEVGRILEQTSIEKGRRSVLQILASNLDNINTIKSEIALRNMKGGVSDAEDRYLQRVLGVEMNSFIEKVTSAPLGYFQSNISAEAIKKLEDTANIHELSLISGTGRLEKPETYPRLQPTTQK